jgi:hypothetical protein
MTFSRDVDYDTGAFLVRDFIFERIDSEFRNEARRVSLDENVKDSESSSLELQREMVRKFRVYRELLFGNPLFSERQGFSFVWENFEIDEDTFEEVVCRLPSDINYYSSLGDILVGMDFRLYGMDVSLELDRILVRDLLVGFSFFFFKYRLFDFLEDNKEREEFFSSLRVEGFDVNRLKESDWLTFILYRAKLF